MVIFRGNEFPLYFGLSAINHSTIKPKHHNTRVVNFIRMKRKVKIKKALKSWRALPLEISFAQIELWIKEVKQQ